MIATQPKRCNAEDYALIHRAQAGDDDARNALITKHYPFICKMVIVTVVDGEPDDFMSVGVEAMIRAIMRFRTETGHSLLTYAGHCIRRAVWKAHREDRTIRVPASGRKNPKTIAAATLANHVKQFDHPAKGQKRPKWDWVEGATDEPSVDSADEFGYLMDLVAILPAPLAQVVRCRMDGMTLQEIGESVGVCRERVRQRLAEARVRMAELMGEER